MTTLSNRLDKNWRRIIAGEFDYTALEQFLQREKADGQTIYPKDEEIFNAFNLAPFKNIKVVIIGQDPYHGKGQAHGLASRSARTLKKSHGAQKYLRRDQKRLRYPDAEPW